MSLYYALLTVGNNKNKKSIKFQGDILIFCDFIQVYVFTPNHHLNNYFASQPSVDDQNKMLPNVPSAQLYCAFKDFEKAFDTVWRLGLWKKLIDSTIRGKCFRVIFNLYQNIKSCVLVNGNRSSFFPCTAGVR